MKKASLTKGGCYNLVPDLLHEIAISKHMNDGLFISVIDRALISIHQVPSFSPRICNQSFLSNFPHMNTHSLGSRPALNFLVNAIMRSQIMVQSGFIS